ncbi:MAG TPA: hypothetical protein VFA77_16665 [Candidatus Eisenbacteria bacterium]|nr:hypothetical protein [Candidatus Eisenbacteria bacterium]
MKARTIALTILLAAAPAATEQYQGMTQKEIAEWRAGIYRQISALQATLSQPIINCDAVPPASLADKVTDSVGGIFKGLGKKAGTVVNTGSKSPVLPCFDPTKKDDISKTPAANQNPK